MIQSDRCAEPKTKPATVDEKPVMLTAGISMGRPENMMRIDRNNLIQILVLFIALGVFLGSQWTFRDTLEDDTYISFRYAKNWLDGHGLVYNPGERVEGYTNLLWVLILAGFKHLGGDFEPTAMIACAIIGSLLILLIGSGYPIRSARLRHPHSGDQPSTDTRSIIGALAAFLLATNPSFQAEAAMGLETVLFTLLVTLGVWTAAQDFSDRRITSYPAVWLALAAWTRPEGIWIGALVLAVQTCQMTQSSPLRRNWFASALVFLTAVAALEVFRITYYGEWFPNTFAAKTGAGMNQLLKGWGYTHHFIGQFTYPALAAVLAAPFLSGSFRRFARIPAIWMMLHFIYVISIGGDYKPSNRFFIAILPTMYLFLVFFVHECLRWILRWRFGRIFKITAPLLLVAVSVVYLIVSLPGYHEISGFMKACQAKIRIDRACADWFRRHTLPGETLATEVAGRIPFYTGMVTYDMSGLNDRHIARNAVPFDGMLPAGHDRTDAPYILSRQPDYILFHSVLVTPQPDPSLRGRQINYYESEIWKVRDFHDHYVLRSVRLDGAGYLNFYQRLPASESR